MGVAILLRSKKETKLIHWAARLASARELPLVLIWAQHRRGSGKIADCQELDSVPPELAAACQDLAENGFYFPPEEKQPVETQTEPEPPLCVSMVYSKNLQADVCKLIEQKKVTSLVLPRLADTRAGSEEAALHDYLVGHLACETVLITPGSRETGTCREILAPVGEGPHSSSCLRLANDWASAGNVDLVALHVEPEIDETAKLAAGRILKKAVDRALGSSQENVQQRVELSNSVVQGIERSIGENTDLIVLGIQRVGLSKRFRSGGISGNGGIAGKLVDASMGPTIAVVQSGVPMSSRLGRKFDEMLGGLVPQLPRDMRVKLVERVQRSSRWDFDFILLICLSTVIAAGGLIQDSAAVVIGAMLVAPLMTPLLGAGLAMVQGNPVLFRNTLFTVLRGFLVAFAVAIVVVIVAGWFVPVHLTDELRARGQPTPLDILVAMVGGIAAAYASGRPNLLSALPGVAIAAALVPPIATSGISLWLGDFGLSFRSALLFVTNIVAIILGTALAFRATGIRGVHQHGTFDRWSLSAAGVLLVLMIALGVFESMQPSANDGTSMKEVVNRIAKRDTWTCKSTAWENIDGERYLAVQINSNSGMNEQQLNEIRENILAESKDKISIRFSVETLTE